MLDIRPFPPIVSLFGHRFNILDRCLGGFLMAFVVGLAIGRPIINFLIGHRIHQVFRTRQQVKNLAVLHGSKIGVPTMGGVIILFASTAAIIVWAAFNDMVVMTLIVYLACTLMGAMDDALKIIRENSKGLAAWQKLFLHGLITALVWHIASKNPPIKHLLTYADWQWCIENFTPQTVTLIAFGFLFLVIAGTSNAVNITDGIDGLAISNIMQCLFFFGVVAFFSRDFPLANKSLLTYISGSGELAVLCACFLGGSLAFFAFNLFPASVFMGDMGAIGLGGLLAIIALLLRQPFILILVGSIFVIETISVALQVTSKKIFRRKIFRMAPLHHHFELKGCAELKIIKVASVIQAVCLAVAFFIVFYGCIKFH